MLHAAFNDTEGILLVLGHSAEHAIQEYLEITAVSYTHLRAHETVLDLVCRLLLEKKQTKSSIAIIPICEYTTQSVTRTKHDTNVDT